MAKPFYLLLLIAYMGFIGLGLPDATHGVTWPSVRDSFGLGNSGLGLIIAGGGLGYLCSSFIAGRLVAKLGVGTLLAGSSLVVTLGLAGFALAPNWLWFLAATPLIGLGSGAIDAGLNTYAAQHFSTRHMNWLHASFGIGVTTSPLLVTGVLVLGWDWRWGYWLVAALLAAMTGLFFLTRHWWQRDANSATKAPSDSPWATFRHPVVVIQMPLFFVYTGLELGLGQWAFTILSESRDFTLAQAGTWTGLYWGSLAIGRFVFGWLVSYVATDSIIRLATVLAVVGISLLTLNLQASLSIFGLLLTGFACAPIFPSLVSRTHERLGPAAAGHAIGFQVSAAMLGAMTLPFLSGLLSKWVNLEAILWFCLSQGVLLLLLHEALLRVANRKTLSKPKEKT